MQQHTTVLKTVEPEQSPGISFKQLNTSLNPKSIIFLKIFVNLLNVSRISALQSHVQTTAAEHRQNYENEANMQIALDLSAHLLCQNPGKKAFFFAVRKEHSQNVITFFHKSITANIYSFFA